MNEYSLFQKYLNILDNKNLIKSKILYSNYLSFIFQDVSFKNKNVLDIGGGSGKFSFYAAIMGAKSVLCLEPELSGSIKKEYEKFCEMKNLLKLENVFFISQTIQNYKNQKIKYDIVILHNSINHLNEDACVKLDFNKESEKEYISIFKKINCIMSPKGIMVITDVSNYNVFPKFKLINPFEPNIEWHKHQTPEVWIKILKNSGFIEPKLSWTTFSYFKKIAGKTISSRFLSYFISSHFLLVIHKL